MTGIVELLNNRFKHIFVFHLDCYDLGKMPEFLTLFDPLRTNPIFYHFHLF